MGVQKDETLCSVSDHSRLRSLENSLNCLYNRLLVSEHVGHITFSHTTADSVVDLQVSVANVDVPTGVEVIGEMQTSGSVAGSGVGALQGDEVRRQEFPQCGVAGADKHSELVTGTATSQDTSSLQWGRCRDP